MLGITIGLLVVGLNLVAPGQLPISKWWVVNWNKLKRREKGKLK